MIDPRFPDAPAGAYVTDEGWLVVGDEAWTEAEWRERESWRPRTIRRRQPEDEEARRELHRIANRAYRERQRLGLPRIRRRRAA